MREGLVAQQEIDSHRLLLADLILLNRKEPTALSDQHLGDGVLKEIEEVAQTSFLNILTFAQNIAAKSTKSTI